MSYIGCRDIAVDFLKRRGLSCWSLDEVDVLRQVAFGNDHDRNKDQLILAVWWFVVGMNARWRYCM
jgi:hypothetical protein